MAEPAYEEIRTTIKELVESLANEELTDLEENIFIKSTFIDSLNMINLIVYLEEKYGIEIDAFYMDRESVSSVSKLAAMIQRKLETQGADHENPGSAE